LIIPSGVILIELRSFPKYAFNHYDLFIANIKASDYAKLLAQINFFHGPQTGFLELDQRQNNELSVK